MWAVRPRTPPSWRAAWTFRPWWARAASQLVRQDDWVIIDGDAGVMIVDPSPIILAEYGFRQRQGELERERLARLRHTPAVTIDGQEDRTAGQHRTAR